MTRKTLFTPIIILVCVVAITVKMQIPSRSESMSQAAGGIPPWLIFLGAGARYASPNGTKALFVNLFDNINTHPNPMVPDPSMYSPTHSSVPYILEKQGFTVTPAADIPTDITPYDVVVLEAIWACEPSNEPIIRDYLFNGGGVVLLGSAPVYLANYCKNFNAGTNLSLVEDWVGASGYSNTGGDATAVVDNPLGTSFHVGDVVIANRGYSAASMGNLHPDTEILAKWETGKCFAFTHTYGSGRLFYQADEEVEKPIFFESIKVNPESPTYEDDVSIIVKIIEGFPFDHVFLSYWTDSVSQKISMNADYVNTFNASIPAQEYGSTIQYRILANDTSGLWIMSPTYSYTVSDPVPPQITIIDISPDPSEDNTTEITGSIVEPEKASGLKAVSFSFMDSHGQLWNTTMTYDETGDLWTVIVPAQPHNSSVQFWIVAYDNAGNISTEDSSFISLPELSAYIIPVLSILSTALILVAKKSTGTPDQSIIDASDVRNPT